MIRACGLLVEHRISFRCEIFGEGPLENQLRAQIEDSGLQERVQLLGAKPQHDLREHLARANVFVMPSVAEAEGGMDNLPTVIMEAMAPACRLFRPGSAGFQRWSLRTRQAFLCNRRMLVALVGAIEKVTNDRSLGRRLGQAGYERAQKLFSIEKNARDLCALLNVHRAD